MGKCFEAISLRLGRYVSRVAFEHLFDVLYSLTSITFITILFRFFFKPLNNVFEVPEVVYYDIYFPKKLN
ncbi:MAG: hypothetical protein ACPLRT_03675 [Thermoproteota archaeon]